MEMVNGYVFLDLTKANVYAKALKVLGADKPVVIKDGSGSPYFVDSLTLDGTNVVITKGGKTITIANDNTITNVGDIQNHLYKLAIEFKFKINDAEDERIIICTLDYNKNNISFDDFLEYMEIGDFLYNSDDDVVCVVSAKGSNNSLQLRYFDNGTWTEFDNYVENSTLTYFKVNSYVQLF